MDFKLICLFVDVFDGFCPSKSLSRSVEGGGILLAMPFWAMLFSLSHYLRPGWNKITEQYVLGKTGILWLGTSKLALQAAVPLLAMVSEKRCKMSRPKGSQLHESYDSILNHLLIISCHIIYFI